MMPEVVTKLYSHVMLIELNTMKPDGVRVTYLHNYVILINLLILRATYFSLKFRAKEK